MNIFRKIFKKIKSLFLKKEEIVMLDIGQEDLNNERKEFMGTLKVKIEKVYKSRKKVETDTCYGDGLGIKNKIEY